MGPERIQTVVIESFGRLGVVVAQRIAALIRAGDAAGRPTVLGLATGSTPLDTYRELIRMHRENGLSFRRVVTFNLDEYFPMDPRSPHSYHRYMWENFFERIDIDPANAHLPRGDVPEADVEEECRRYEAAIRSAGGIDLQLLGLGRTGHIGFNEPGSGRDSRTRIVYLDTITRRDAAADFFGEDNVPSRAVTMGVASILEAREILLLVAGEHKARIVRRAVEGPIAPDVAATYVQEHPKATVFVDPAAAAELTRIKTPWLLDEIEWSPQREIQAVVWLSGQAGKSVLRLSDQDYRDHHLSMLIARHGSAGPINGEVFNTLMAKIRGRSKLPSGRRILVFSPHPDDDVISMGGILHKLHANGNEISVAYQTSGNIAVFDHEVRRHLDLMERVERGFDLDVAPLMELRSRIESFLDGKTPGQVDIPEVQAIKRAIRESESVAALASLGIPRDRARFMNLPFYRTGQVRKDPIGDEDVGIVHRLLEEVRPDMVFAAGDLSDPHGTHRMCLEAVERALQRYSRPAPELWLYRGAWEEWPVSEASVLVPLSEAELRRKILAIFRHESQKDKAPFPGPDEREFWQRVEERNRGTATMLEELGLPAYFAIEVFVVEPPSSSRAS